MTGRPFLLLSLRPERAAADNEYSAFLQHTGLDETGLPRLQLTAEELGPVDLADWSGIILGGGPFNASDPVKSPLQQRIETEISDLLDQVIARDFPFLGACYGIGALGTHLGATIDQTYAEPVGPLAVTLTPEGHDDPLLRGVPARFSAYGGHKEAISRLPQEAVQLASSAACPVQAFKVGDNVYATQFHPELDFDGLCTRIDVYKDAGYFPPESAEELKRAGAVVSVEHPMRILANFVELFSRA